jgi:hypothetical protein
MNVKFTADEVTYSIKDKEEHIKKQLDFKTVKIIKI